MKNVLIALTISLGAVSGFAEQGGTTIGSGGDALRELYQNAKGIAATKVQQITTCSFDPSTPQSIQDWIIANQTQLAMDIRLSSHAWVVDSQATCAFTNHSAQSTVYLSYPTCASTGNSLDAALFTLIHESAHHLGIHDERQADDVARAVMYSRYVPSCSSQGGIFDPNVCSSAPLTTEDVQKYFQPGQSQALVGSYKFYGQITRCTTLSGCTQPKPWKFTTYLTYGNGTTSYNAGAIQLLLTPQDSTPFFLARLKLNWYYGSNEMTSMDFPFTNPLLDYGGYRLNFYGTLFEEGSATAVVGTSSNTTETRLRKNCLWSKWSDTKTVSNGVTDKIEVVLYGTH